MTDRSAPPAPRSATRPERTVGCYVHHHGSGHAAHATALARALPGPCVGLGSGPRPDGWPGDWVHLDRDDRPVPHGDPGRGGAWHWVPAAHRGFTSRMRTVAGWIGDADPAAMVVDVSTEVTALAALLGVPTVTVVLPGERADAPHTLALATADAIVAPWPASGREPWLAPWADKLHPIGLLSRHDGRPDAADPDGSVLLVLPAGGHAFTASQIEGAARATGRPWHVIGAPPVGARPDHGSPITWHGHVADPWPLLTAAAVVVGAAGLGTVADTAAARRPALLFPQDRPFGEQQALTTALSDHGAPVRLATHWPDTDRWRTLVAETEALDPAAWDGLHDGHAGARFAAVIGAVTAEPSPSSA